MRVSSGRRSAVIVATLATVLIMALGAPAAAAKAPPGLQRFMHAIAKVESGGRYAARNSSSGAYGKYQIMPSNWPSWAKRYLGSSKARMTAANQDKVAAGKFTTLFHKYGEWRRVAYWWLTGSSKQSGWSSYARRYVAKVMRNYRTANGSGASTAASIHISDGHSAIVYTGTWTKARRAGYASGAVRYAKAAGATASLTFTGKGIVWYGPTGRNRGQARVSIDGVYVRTVDLQRSGFTARRKVFRMTWATAATRTVTIEVVGTAGRPAVAIDEFIVRP